MNVSKVTEIIYKYLKNNDTSLNWDLYPNYQKLNIKHLPIAILEVDNIELISTHSDLHNIELSYNLRLLYSDNRENKLKIRDKALELAILLDGNNYDNQDIQNTHILVSQPDVFTPEVEGFIAWEIAFIVSYITGDSIYANNDISEDFLIEVRENAN